VSQRASGPGARAKLREAIELVREGRSDEVLPSELTAIADLAARQLVLIEAAGWVRIDQAHGGGRP